MQRHLRVVRDVNSTARENVSKADLKRTPNTLIESHVQTAQAEHMTINSHLLNQRGTVENHHRVEKQARQEEVQDRTEQSGQLQKENEAR